MADQTPAPANASRQIQGRIDESKCQTTYASFFRPSGTMSELIIDFGVNMPAQTTEGQPALIIHLLSRVCMNWQVAKQLAISLGQTVRQYEEQVGPIPMPQQAPQGGAAGTGGGNGPRLAN
jgi:Protein of unknown function (DUF3467)